jgi:DNA repair exonuclease SbcCD ATPase subunit
MATTGGGNEIENLRRFLGVVTATIEQVKEQAETLEDHADRIDDLDSESDSGLEDLQSALQEFEDDLESDEEDTLEKIQDLREDVREGTSQRLARSEQDVDQAGTEWDGVLEQGKDDLEQGLGELTSDGFEQLETALTTVESDLAQDRQQAEAGFDGFETGVDELQQRVTGAIGDDEGAFDQTAQAIANSENALETDGGDTVRALGQQGDEIDGECRALAGELEALYDAYRGEISVEGQDLIDSAERLFKDAAEGLDSATDDQIDTPAQAVMTDALDVYLGELGSLESTIDSAGKPTADEMAMLVDDLEKAMAIIDQIDELLSALG